MSRILVLAIALASLSANAFAEGSFITSDAFGARLGALRTAVLKAPDGGKGFRLASNDERDTLERLLQDPDPAIRLAAVRALKAYVSQRSDTRRDVLRVLQNHNEKIEVRLQAAKTLSIVAGQSDVRRYMLNYAQRGNDASLRAMCYKALYWEASSRSSVRRDLLSAALRETNKEVRLGAIWGLFAASQNSDVRREFIRISAHDPDMDVRVEALKSLYGAVGHHEVRKWALRLAKETQREKEIRLPAILMLSGVISSRTEDALVYLARYESEKELREAAILALNRGDERIKKYFHVIRRDQNNRLIDPLENE